MSAPKSDLLVKLYALPAARSPSTGNVNIRRAFTAERWLVRAWVTKQFGAGWASESETAFGRLPVSCFVAVREKDILEFACYDSTARGMFGPMGVAQSERNHGIGSLLLLATLHDMTAQGYAYAVIGRPDSAEFYRKHAGATEIADSDPGFYTGLIKQL